MKFKEKFGIKNSGVYKSFIAAHSYNEWTEMHNINSEEKISDIDAILKETKHILEKLLDIYEKA